MVPNNEKKDNQKRNVPWDLGGVDYFNFIQVEVGVPLGYRWERYNRWLEIQKLSLEKRSFTHEIIFYQWIRGQDGLIKGSKTIVILGCRNQKADHWIYEVKWGDSKNEKRKELKVKG